LNGIRIDKKLPQINNKTGITGIHYNALCKKWKAQLNKDKKRIHLGYFVDFFDACCAVKSGLNRLNL